MQPNLPTAAAAAALGATLLLSGGAALAQGLPGGASSLNETHGDWRMICATPQAVVRCAISQTQVSGQNRQRVLTIELAATDPQAAAGAAASGTLVLPFGLELQAGVQLALDAAPPFDTLPFSTCLPAGCLVPLAFTAETVAALQAATALKVGAVAHDGGQAVNLSISLAGFASALARATELGG